MPERTFARWCAKGLPSKGDGTTARFPWPEIHRWLLQQVEQRGRESAKPKDIDEARERKAAADAELAELELAEKRHQLMTVEAGEAALGAAYARVATRLKAAPNKYAPRTVNLKSIPESLTIWQRAVHEVMDELYQGRDVPVPDDQDQAVDHEDADRDD